ncbi:MAG: hypothetical protein JWO61_5 [Candidatus Saccharibacteria bacterium]|nr:hypothetical protein [Candidatus Saccharibacteria bacterium]
MTDMVRRFDNVRRIYSSNEGRLRFKPSPELDDALRGMMHPQSRLGRSALFLYSPAQVFIKRFDSDPTEPSAQLNSQVQARIRSYGSRQYPLARSVIPWVKGEETEFQFSAQLDPLTQQQLHACYPYGLNQTTFGRKVIEVSFFLPHDDIVTSKDERREASRQIKKVIWGSDNINSPHDPLNTPSNKGTFVDGIEWIVDKR